MMSIYLNIFVFVIVNICNALYHDRLVHHVNDSYAIHVVESPGNETVHWPVPLPMAFHYYDLDGDGVIMLKELAKVTGTSRNDARMPFEAADLNSDKRITPNEFNQAPWLFGDEFHPPIIQHNSTSPNPKKGKHARRKSKKQVRRQHSKKPRLPKSKKTSIT